MRYSTLAAMAMLAGPVALGMQPGSHEPDAALRRAIEIVESGGNPKAVGDGGRAVGILQIQPIMVSDVNRILALGRHRDSFTLSDRSDIAKSRRMFWIYTMHYSRGASRETIARRWNGGPKGDTKAATLAYWTKVQAALRTLDPTMEAE